MYGKCVNYLFLYTPSPSDLIMVDECSIERNRLLVSCYFVGGPTERVLPPHYLTKVSPLYTLFCDVPRIFQVVAIFCLEP